MEKIGWIILLLLICLLNLAEPEIAGAELLKDTHAEAQEQLTKILERHTKICHLYISDPISYIKIEPNSWKLLEHQDKENMCMQAKSFIVDLNQKRGKKIDSIQFKDMTSRATLAKVCLQDGHMIFYSASADTHQR